ncbi:hypothetical protein Sjap_010402 [Stephania japonica]|uniref:Major facilitator superfamily (MFS) profile domain-containing protein n=1 Tax=Stephania japonica TaxID=461633 RepID=A0AAP0JB47_9MAGN
MTDEKAVATTLDHKKPKLSWYAFGCAFLSSAMFSLLGYDAGVMSGAVMFIQQNFNLSDVQVEIMMGIMNLYSIIGAATAGRTSDLIGRRYTILMASIMLFVGALIMGLAPDYAVLMLGRFIAGVAIGFAVNASVYISEIVPATSRGFFCTFPRPSSTSGFC